MAKNINIDIGGVNRTRQAFQSVLKDARRLGRQVSASAGRAGRSLQGVGTRMFALGTISNVGIGMAIKSFAEFDDQIARLGAVSMNATAHDIENLRDLAVELGSTTVFTAKEAAEGMALLSLSGMQAREVMEGIGPVLNMAAAGSLELSDAASIAADATRAFELQAQEIGVVADVIARGATTSNTTVEKMGETFQFIAPSAKLAGQSIQETAAAIAILANKGQKASIAGTQLDQMMAKLVEHQQELKDMGVDIGVEGNFRPMLDILRDLGRETEHMGNVERLGRFHELFGARAKKAAMILATESIPNMEKFRKLMNEAEGAAATMAEKMLSGLGGAGVKLASAFDGAKNAFVQNLKPMLMEAAARATVFFQRVKQVFEQFPSLSKVILFGSGAITAFGAALAAAGTILVTFGAAVAVVVTSVAVIGTTLAAAFTPAGAVLALVAAELGLVSAAVVKATDNVDGLSSSVSLFEQRSSGLRAAIKSTFDAISVAFKAGDLGLAFKIMLKGFELAFIEGMITILEVASEVAPKILKEFNRVFIDMAVNAGKAMAIIADTLKGKRIFRNAMEVADMLTTTEAPAFDLVQYLKDLRDQSEMGLSKLTFEAQVAAFFAEGKRMGESLRDGIVDGIASGSGIINDTVKSIFGLFQTTAERRQNAKELFQELFGASPSNLKGVSPKSENIFDLFGGRIGATLIGGKKFTPAGDLQATQGRLLGGGRTKIDAMEELAKSQLKEQKQMKRSLLDIDENLKRDERQKITIDITQGMIA